jgi:hypothetical protein
VHDQKLIIFAFMAVFVSYCPLFGVLGVYMAHDTHEMFERYDQKPVILKFLGRFLSYCPQFWVFGVIFKAHDT